MTDWLALIQDHAFFGILVTIASYGGATLLWKRFGSPALLHPVLVATTILAALLMTLDMRYEDYMAQVSILHEALALVIVLLAVPLWRQMPLIVRAHSPIAWSLVAGSTLAIGSAILLPRVLQSADWVYATLAPKSATAAIAVQIAEQLGGMPGLTAVVVISTGLFGAVFGPGLLRVMRVEDDRAKGFALGLASHALGTARAFQISDVAGAFASVGMILNALLTVALAPLAVALLAN